MERIAEIKNYEKLFLQAIKDNNLDLRDKLLHSDLQFVNPKGLVVTKEMDMANYNSGEVSIEKITVNDQTIRLIDKTAVVTVKIGLKGKYHGQVMDENFQYIRVWMQFEDNWKIVAGSCVRL